MTERLANLVAALNSELGWKLSEATREAYVAELGRLLPNDCSDLAIKRAIVNFHQDGDLVRSLSTHEHQQHEKAWGLWMSQVLAILRSKGLDWSTDSAVDIEDLAQVARMELARSIHGYKYESRFATWAYQVVVRSVLRQVRDSQAIKRAQRPQSLDRSPEVDVAIPDIQHPEAIANAAVLSDLIDAVLQAQPDPRLVQIFRLWVHEDRRVVEIGARLGLSEARVRALLGQITELLRGDPAISRWVGD